MSDMHNKVVLKTYLGEDHFEYDFAKDEFDFDDLEHEQITHFGLAWHDLVTKHALELQKLEIEYWSFHILSTIHTTRKKLQFKSNSEKLFARLIKDIHLTDKLQSYIKQETKWIFQLYTIFCIINQIIDLPQSIDIDYFAEDNHFLVVYTIEVDNFEDRRKVRSEIVKMLKKKIPTINFVDFLVDFVVLGE